MNIQNSAPIEEQINVTSASEVNFYGSKRNRLSASFEKLNNEILKNIRKEIVDELKQYKTKQDGTLGLEKKLKDGGFNNNFIKSAMAQKEMYAKKATKYECYPSAQQINLSIFARIKTKFNIYIVPLIEKGESTSTIMEKIDNQIVDPIMNMIFENGADDSYLQYTEDHIYGMIYYLTGMCHLNWKVYDNL